MKAQNDREIKSKKIQGPINQIIGYLRACAHANTPIHKALFARALTHIITFRFQLFFQLLFQLIHTIILRICLSKSVNK